MPLWPHYWLQKGETTTALLVRGLLFPPLFLAFFALNFSLCFEAKRGENFFASKEAKFNICRFPISFRVKKKTFLSIFSLNFRFTTIFSLNFRLFYLRFRFRFLVFRIEVNHVKSGFFSLPSETKFSLQFQISLPKWKWGRTLAHMVVLILQFNFYCSVSVPAMPIQIPSLLFSFTYCSAHKIVMNLSVSVSAVSVPVSDVQLQFFYPIPLLSSCSIPVGFSFCCFSFSVCCSVLYTALLTRLF